MSAVEVLGQGAVPGPKGTVTKVAVTNVACFGRTYPKHAAELGNPVPPAPLVFLKSTRALRGLDGGALAFDDETFHHEAEVVLLVGRSVALGARPGWDDVEAVGLGLDLTRREVQSRLKDEGHPWTTAKSFAGAALVSPLTPIAEVAERDAIAFWLEVEGERRQEGTTAALTHDVPALLAMLAELTPLDRGDLVFTGTPEGVGPIRRGDRFTLGSTQLGVHDGVL